MVVDEMVEVVDGKQLNSFLVMAEVGDGGG